MKCLYPYDDQERNEPEVNLVPGIYKYCDRWCELCHARKRCALFIEQSAQERLKEERDERNLQRLIHVDPEEFGIGIDLDEVYWPTDDAEDFTTYTRYLGLRKLTSDYLEDVIDWTQMFMSEMRECPEAIECRNALCYYAVVIMSRICMAELVEGLNERAQVERLGYARVVQVSLDYSLRAWEIADELTDYTDDEIPRMKIRVKEISKILETGIPGGKNFVRRGLDD